MHETIKICSILLLYLSLLQFSGGAMPDCSYGTLNCSNHCYLSKITDTYECCNRVCDPRPNDYVQSVCEGVPACSSMHGGWSAWSEWGECTSVCDEPGTKTSLRSCTNPEPKLHLNGKKCVGDAVKITKCFLPSAVRKRCQKDRELIVALIVIMSVTSIIFGLAVFGFVIARHLQKLKEKRGRIAVQSDTEGTEEYVLLVSPGPAADPSNPSLPISPSSAPAPNSGGLPPPASVLLSPQHQPTPSQSIDPSAVAPTVADVRLNLGDSYLEGRLRDWVADQRRNPADAPSAIMNGVDRENESSAFDPNPPAEAAGANNHFIPKGVSGFNNSRFPNRPITAMTAGQSRSCPHCSQPILLIPSGDGISLLPDSNPTQYPRSSSQEPAPDSRDLSSFSTEREHLFENLKEDTTTHVKTPIVSQRNLTVSSTSTGDQQQTESTFVSGDDSTQIPRCVEDLNSNEN